MIWYRRNRYILISLAVTLIAAALVVEGLASPFGLRFWGVVYACIAGVVITMGLIGLRLLAARTPWKIVIGALFGCASLGLLGITAVGTIDFRLFFFREIPRTMTPAQWREDLRALAAAIRNYKKALELNPGNTNAAEMLRRLE